MNWGWEVAAAADWDWGWEGVAEAEPKAKGGMLLPQPSQGDVVGKSTAYMLACFYGKVR